MGKGIFFLNLFFVLATQNPMEMEGTYPLPEAQLDRFMFKISTISDPGVSAEISVGRLITNSLS